MEYVKRKAENKNANFELKPLRPCFGISTPNKGSLKMAVLPYKIIYLHRFTYVHAI